MDPSSAAVDALRWRLSQLPSVWAVSDVLAALSVEGLPYSAIPSRHWAGVRAFRRLRSDARERFVVRFFGGTLRAREKAASRAADAEALQSGRKTPAELRNENSHFARLRVTHLRGSRPLA